MIKRHFRDTPKWFLFVWIADIILIAINFFYLGAHPAINMLALAIINFANAIRIWNSQRGTAIMILLLSFVCTFLFIKYLF